MMPERQPGAVVACEDHVGSLDEAQFVERVEQPAHLRVEVLDRVHIGLPRIGIADVVGHIERNMRHRVGQVDEKRPGAVPAHKVDRPLRAAAGDGPLICG